MSNFESMTESFESKLVENIVTVRLRSESQPLAERNRRALEPGVQWQVDTQPEAHER